MVIDYIIIYIPCKYTFSQLNYIIYISSCPNLFYIFYYPPTIIFYYSKNFLCTVLKISKHPCSFCAVWHGDASFCLLSSPQPKRTPLPIFLPVTRFLYPIFILLSTSPLLDRTTVFFGDMPHNSCDNAMPSRNLSSPHRGKADDYLLAYLSAIAACAAASLAIGTRKGEQDT